MSGRCICGSGGDVASSSGGSPSQDASSPNTLRSSATSRVVLAMCEGEIKGVVDGDKSIYFGDTPLQGADGTYNFQGVTWQGRPGTPDQSYLAGFPAIENDVSVEADVTKANPITRRIDNASANAVRVRLQLPQGLMSQNSRTGALDATSVAVAIEVRPSGGVYARAVDDTITGKTTSAWEKTYRVPLTGSAPWDIRLVRITDDSTSAYLRNTTKWASYTEVIDRKCTYPYTALLGVAVDGKKFGSSVPTISADVYGKIIQVPSNYDPATRVYTGIWDGTFKLAWSDNAAWCFYDMCRNARYGLGLPDSGLKWYLYEIGQYCDDLVPDGYGGLEPRFACNLVLSTQEDAYQVISSMASIFRGMVYWASGAAACSQDRPMEASHIVTPAKVVDGSLSYSGTDLKSRHTVCLVTWNDPQDGGKPAIEVVEDQEGIRRYGWRQTDKVSVGCRSRGQAHRCGKWVIETELNETQILSFVGGLEYADAEPGCILKVLDPEVADVRHSGLIRTATVGQVVLDAPVTIEAGQPYLLSVVLPDKKVVDATVTNAPGQTDTLTLASPLPAAPLPGGAWVLSYALATARYFRTLSNREVKLNQFEISAVEHDPAKYARIEQGLLFDTPQVSRIPTGPLAAPSNLTLREYLYTQGSGISVGALLSWEHPADARIVLYEAELLTSYGDVLPLGTTSICSLDIRDLSPGVYGLRVRSLSRLSIASPWTTLEAVRLLGLMAPPPALSGLYRQGGTIYWTYDNAPVDLDGYRVRVVGGLTQNWLKGTDWPSAGAITKERSIDATALGSGVTTIMVKPIDTSGIEADSAAFLTINLGEYSPANLISTVDLKAQGFPGTIVGGAVDSSGNLSAHDSGGAYLPDADAFYLPQPGALYLPLSYVGMSYAFEYVPAADSISGTAYLALTASGDGWIISYRRRGTLDVYLGHDDEQYLTDGSALYLGGTTPWAGYSAGVEVRREKLDFLIQTDSGNRQGAILALTVNIDVADIFESFEDLIITSSGTRVPIKKSYRKIDQVGAITLQADGHGATGIKVLDKNPKLGPMLAAVGASQATIDIHNLKGH